MFGWLFGKRGDDGSAQTMSDIVRGIAHAAESANDVGDQAILNQFRMFFDVGPDGSFTAKTARVKMADGGFVDVPLITLIDPSTVVLDEMEVRMSVRVTKADVKEQVHAANEDAVVQRSSFSVALSGAKPGSRDDVVDVVMKFKRAPPQEMASRLSEELASRAVPKREGPDTPPPGTGLTGSITRQRALNEKRAGSEYAPHPEPGG